jgi:hypothetical protein
MELPRIFQCPARKLPPTLSNSASTMDEADFCNSTSRTRP